MNFHIMQKEDSADKKLKLACRINNKNINER